MQHGQACRYPGRPVAGGAVHHNLDHGLLPHHAVDKLDPVYLVVGDAGAVGHVGGVVAGHYNIVRRAFDLEDHVVAGLPSQHIGRGNAGTKPQRIHRAL